MRHNWLVIVVCLGPSAHITREQLGAEQTGQAPHLKQSSLLAASAKNSGRKLLDRTPHLHCASTNSQTWTTRSSSQRCIGPITVLRQLLAPEVSVLLSCFPRLKVVSTGALQEDKRNARTVGMPVEAGLPLLPTL
jgi:hypothetical protein